MQIKMKAKFAFCLVLNSTADHLDLSSEMLHFKKCINSDGFCILYIPAKSKAVPHAIA